MTTNSHTPRTSGRPDFFGTRLRIARRLSRRTQEELARAAGVDQAVISHAERGLPPSADAARALADALGVLPSFFEIENSTQLFDEEVHFRRRKTTRTVDRQQALAHASMFVEFVHVLEEHVEFPADRIPRITANSVEEIELAASACRAACNLPQDAPLENVIRVLENAGIVVVMTGGYVDKVDAFSAESPSGRKIIILNSNDPPSRTVFNAAHELAHLVLHRGRETGDKKTESEANRFASAFLMPRCGIARELPRGRVDWGTLFRLKSRWRVSVQALLRRALDLDIIGASEYTRGCKYISSKRWTKREPGEFEAPNPEVAAQALDVVTTDLGVSLYDLAYTLRLEPATLGIVAGIEIPIEHKDGIISLAAHRARHRLKPGA